VPTDLFAFYRSVSSVYSSRIEGEGIDFDSYYKHRFLNVEYRPDYTQKADDLFAAYEYMEGKALTLDHLKEVHSILSANLLPSTQRGAVRNNPMFVIGDDERIEYVAADPNAVEKELEKLFSDVQKLRRAELSTTEIFLFASLIHLVFVKIHPFEDGNGRAARLLEKWFLTGKMGELVTSVQLEKNYFAHLKAYYSNLRKLGLEYETLNYDLATDFLLMTIHGLRSQSRNIA